MAEETATYISQLVDTNPVHTDGLDQADYHLRLIKSVLQNQFPNFTAAALVSSNSELDAAINLLTGTSGQATLPVGSVSSPSVAFFGDTDSGIYHPGEDAITLTLDGAAVSAWTTSGESLTGNFSASGTVTATGAFTGGTGQIAVPGVIWMYQGGSAPTGWAWMNGQTVSASSNPGLASIYGSSGGNVTIPDFRCYVPIGQDNMGAAGTTSRIANYTLTSMNAAIGEDTHTLTTTQCPTGLITFNDVEHTHTISNSGGIYISETGANGPPTGGSGLNESGTLTNAASFTGASITDHGGNGAHNITQLGITVGFIIKLG